MVSAPSSTDRASGFGPEDVGSIPAERAKRKPREGRHVWIVTEHDYFAHGWRGSALRERARLTGLYPEKTFRVVRLSRQNAAGAAVDAKRLSQMPAVAALSGLPAPAAPTESDVAGYLAKNIEHYLRRATVIEVGGDGAYAEIAAECARIALATFNAEAPNV